MRRGARSSHGIADGSSSSLSSGTTDFNLLPACGVVYWGWGWKLAAFIVDGRLGLKKACWALCRVGSAKLQYGDGVEYALAAYRWSNKTSLSMLVLLRLRLGLA